MRAWKVFAVACVLLACVPRSTWYVEWDKNEPKRVRQRQQNPRAFALHAQSAPGSLCQCQVARNNISCSRIARNARVSVRAPGPCCTPCNLHGMYPIHGSRLRAVAEIRYLHAARSFGNQHHKQRVGTSLPAVILPVMHPLVRYMRLRVINVLRAGVPPHATPVS